MTEIHGHCDEAFASVREQFARHFDEGQELGASVCVTKDGETVVDLWGGDADTAGRPWEQDTICNVWSTTKTMSAIVLLMLADRGEIDLDSPVATYWPEFAANGKERVLVRHVLAHTAGEDAYPGSTMFGFTESAKAGVDMLDFNVTLSKDDVLVVQHDLTVDRLTNATGNVVDKTYAELAALDNAYWFTDQCGACTDKPADAYVFRGVRTGEKPAPAGYTAEDFKIPTLQDVLTAFPAHTLNIEIKGEGALGARTATVLAEELTAAGALDRVVVTSFDDATVDAFRALAPSVAVASDVQRPGDPQRQAGGGCPRCRLPDLGVAERPRRGEPRFVPGVPRPRPRRVEHQLPRRRCPRRGRRRGARVELSTARPDQRNRSLLWSRRTGAIDAVSSASQASPRITPTGTRDTLPLTSSAAPANSSAKHTAWTLNSWPCGSCWPM